jgi:hypothetical protein
MIEQLLLNSCWSYKCIVSSQLYDMLTLNDTAMGIWLWLMYPLAGYGLYNVMSNLYNITATLLRRFT